MRARAVLVALTIALALCQRGQAQSAPANPSRSDQQTLDDTKSFIPGYDQAKVIGKAFAKVFGPSTPDNSESGVDLSPCHFWESEKACVNRHAPGVWIDENADSPAPASSTSSIIRSQPQSGTTGSSRPATYFTMGCDHRDVEFNAGNKSTFVKSSTCNEATQKVATMSKYATYYNDCMSPDHYSFAYGRYEEAVAEQTSLCGGGPSDGWTRTGVPDSSASSGSSTGVTGSPASQQLNPKNSNDLSAEEARLQAALRGALQDSSVQAAIQNALVPKSPGSNNGANEAGTSTLAGTSAPTIVDGMPSCPGGTSYLNGLCQNLCPKGTVESTINGFRACSSGSAGTSSGLSGNAKKGSGSYCGSYRDARTGKIVTMTCP